MGRTQYVLACVWAVCVWGAVAAPAAADVVIEGDVRIFNTFSNQYEPANGARVRVVLGEYSDADTFDAETTCDANGHYRVTKGNAWFRSGYRAQVIVFAEWPNKLEVQSRYMQIDGYHAVSPSFFAGDDHTTRRDISIGGGSDSTDHYEVGGINGIAGDSVSTTRGRSAFLIYHEMTDHRVRLQDHAFGTNDFEEKEVSYPVDGATASYQCPFDYIRVLDNASWKPGNLPSETFRHELSHGVMADSYDTLTEWVMFSVAGEHELTKVTNPQFALLEGWPEFLAEVTYFWRYGRALYDYETLDSAWHPSVPAGANGCSVEGEVASALWDVFDGVGWEKRRNQVAAVPGVEEFYDGISDPQLTSIRTILKNDNPYTFAGGDDDFVQYWFDRGYGLRHEMKAILYNRGMTVGYLPQTAPQLNVGEVTWQERGVRIPITVTENDAEDRPNVWVEVFVNQTRTQRFRLTDSWNGSRNVRTLDQQIAAIPGQPRPVLTVHVHDDMQSAYTQRTLDPPASAMMGGLVVEVTGLVLTHAQSDSPAVIPNTDLRNLVVTVSAADGRTTGQCRIPIAGSLTVAPGAETRDETAHEVLRSQPLTPRLDLTFSMQGQSFAPVTGTASASYNEAANYGLGTHVARVTTSQSVSVGFAKAQRQFTAEIAYRIYSLPPPAAPVNATVFLPVVPLAQAVPAGQFFVGLLTAAPEAAEPELQTPAALVSRVNRLQDEYARLQARVVEASEVLEWRLNQEKLALVQSKPTLTVKPLPGPGTVIRPRQEVAPDGAAERPQIPMAGVDEAPTRSLYGLTAPEPGKVLQPVAIPFLDSALKREGLAAVLPGAAGDDLTSLRDQMQSMEQRLAVIPTEITQLRARLTKTQQKLAANQKLKPAVRTAYMAHLRAADDRLAEIGPTVTAYRIVLTKARQVVVEGLGRVR